MHLKWNIVQTRKGSRRRVPSCHANRSLYLTDCICRSTFKPAQGSSRRVSLCHTNGSLFLIVFVVLLSNQRRRAGGEFNCVITIYYLRPLLLSSRSSLSLYFQTSVGQQEASSTVPTNRSLSLLLTDCQGRSTSETIDRMAGDAQKLKPNVKFPACVLLSWSSAKRLIQRQSRVVTGLHSSLPRERVIECQGCRYCPTAETLTDHRSAGRCVLGVHQRCDVMQWSVCNVI